MAGVCDSTCEAVSCQEECQTTSSHNGQPMSCANAGLITNAALGGFEGRCAMLVAEGQCTTCTTCDAVPRETIEEDAPCLSGIVPLVQRAAQQCMNADMTDFACKADGCPAVMADMNTLYEGTCAEVDLRLYAAAACTDPGTVCPSATSLPCPAGCTELPADCTDSDELAQQAFGVSGITCQQVAASADGCQQLAENAWQDACCESCRSMYPGPCIGLATCELGLGGPRVIAPTAACTARLH